MNARVLVVASALFLGGCASVDIGSGRYLQAYSNNLLYGEIDYLTPFACKSEVLTYFNPASSTKGPITAACSPESIGEGLPVVSTMTDPKVGKVINMRFASIQVCQSFIKGVGKPEVKIVCGDEK